MMFSKGSFNSNRSIFGIYGNLQGCTPPETALREEPAWQEKPSSCETSQTGPEHCQLCSVAPLQAVESKWVRPEMDLPKPSTMYIDTWKYDRFCVPSEFQLIFESAR